MLWLALTTAVDAALGVEDFFGWWIWENECGSRNFSWMLDGKSYPLTDVREILEFAEAYKEHVRLQGNR